MCLNSKGKESRYKIVSTKRKDMLKLQQREKSGENDTINEN